MKQDRRIKRHIGIPDAFPNCDAPMKPAQPFYRFCRIVYSPGTYSAQRVQVPPIPSSLEFFHQLGAISLSHNHALHATKIALLRRYFEVAIDDAGK